MEKKQESLFQINGKDSWLHCMRILGSKSANAEHTYHYHEYVEFLLFLRGNAKLIVHEKSYQCEPGQLAVIHPGEPHDVVFNRESEYICIKFLPQILFDGEQGISEFSYALPLLEEHFHTRVFSAEQVNGQLLSEIIEEWENREYGCELVIRADILKVYTAVMRIWYREGNYIHSDRIPAYVAKALEHISRNYARTDERETAALCGVAYHHFSAAFRQAIGRTFTQYLTAIRVREAKKLLATTTDSIERIAGEVGFATASHFIHRFKKVTDTTPMQYRKQLQI